MGRRVPAGALDFARHSGRTSRRPQSLPGRRRGRGRRRRRDEAAGCVRERDGAAGGCAGAAGAGGERRGRAERSPLETGHEPVRQFVRPCACFGGVSMCFVEEGVDSCGDLDASPERSSSLWGPGSLPVPTLPCPALPFPFLLLHISILVPSLPLEMRENFAPRFFSFFQDYHV